jgi:hypothetical protein
MMNTRKLILLLFLLACLPSLHAQGIFQVNPGVTIRCNGSPTFRLNDVQWVINGTFDGPMSNVRISGTSPPSPPQIAGTESPEFQNFSVAKSANDLRLGTSITVNGNLGLMTAGIDLNGNNIDLKGTGIILGETESKRIYGAAGTIHRSDDLAFPFSQNPGNIGVAITSAVNIGKTDIYRGHTPQTEGGLFYSIERYFDILPGVNTGLNATVRFLYFDAELNGNLESDIEPWKSTDSGITWNYVASTSRSVLANWVETTGVNSFSRWTLTPFNPVLSASTLDFFATPESEVVKLEWIVDQEIGVSGYEVFRGPSHLAMEKSFSVPATGKSAYQEMDPFPLSGRSWYRLHQINDDGSIRQSQLTEVYFGEGISLQLYPNPVGSELKIMIRVPQSASLEMVILDLHGKEVVRKPIRLDKGLNKVEWDVEPLASGIYFLRFPGLELPPYKIIRE